ncbi:FAD-dependent oxidoreductase [Mycobacterium sp. shizuoka-1]|uniref:FAD-dependent oxidoreductase n=1 Tax=Mycobacterium sp. shizuoka-1 TaxID=2039281 RepID=UPI000C0623C9|nr:FAD-dependent oxidoreductase [Mycobacterium sp. shizuoka-1]GAY19296.1 hypothetical protein MSZK_60220 [Mycobacterium sp. shizuoka-1]
MARNSDDTSFNDEDRVPSWHPDHSVESLINLVRTGRVEKVALVGAGVVGALTAHFVLMAAREVGREVRIVLIDDGRGGASDGSGAWHMPFANPDTRVATWARRSFVEWPEILGEAGLSGFREAMPSLFVSRLQDGVPVPDGHPGRATPIDPADFDLPFWHRGMWIDDGSVISSCTLMPRWRQALEADPSVIVVRNHVRGPADVVTLSETYGVDVVVVAAGARTRFVIGEGREGDQRFDADFGVLVHGELEALPEMFKHVVVMDEDLNHELTYSIPHLRCGHVWFGGVCNEILDEEADMEDILAANRDIAVAPDFARDHLLAVHDRIRERMPMLAPALPADPLAPGSYWFGLRPRASKVIAEWQLVGSLPMLVIGGMGGSGFTIGPAVVSDALRLPLPEGHQIHPGNTRTED